MTDDRIEKIRAEVERLKESGCASPIVICDTLLSFIDSMEEEPELLTGKTQLEKITAVAKSMPRATLKLSPTDNAVSRDWNRRMADAAESLGISQEEPVSDDLEEAAKEYSGKRQDKLNNAFIAGARWQIQKDSTPVSEELEEAAVMHFKDVMEYEVKTGLKMANITSFKAGAQWQKAKDEYITDDLGEYINELSKQFPEVSFAKLSRITVRVAKWQKEQMMKDVVEAT